MKTHAELMNEIRYAEHLCARTARLYRHLQALGTFGAVLSGAAIIAQLSPLMPAWAALGGGILFAAFGALLIAVRPADKAAANESDVRRYRELRAQGVGLSADALHAALERARQSDVAEVESLRRPVWNDVAIEVGASPSELFQLTLRERAVSLLA